MRFKPGDKVTWCGIDGVVVKDWGFPDKTSASLEVEFPQTTALPKVQRVNFHRDGRLHHWHTESSLKVVGDKKKEKEVLRLSRRKNKAS